MVFEVFDSPHHMAATGTAIAYGHHFVLHVVAQLGESLLFAVLQNVHGLSRSNRPGLTKPDDHVCSIVELQAHLLRLFAGTALVALDMMALTESNGYR